MKKLGKILSVGLSLVLCASMVAPALAASFQDVQGAIDSTEESGQSEDGIVTWATKDDIRSVNLNGNVTREDGEGSINISGAAAGVILNLNGHTLDGGGKGGSVISVTNSASLTVNGAGEDGQKGTITGGNASRDGGGVDVSNGSLTVKDSVITGNSAGSGGGVSVVNGSLTLENVDVSNNNTKIKTENKDGYGNGGGGISAIKSNVTLTNVTVTGNRADGIPDEYGDGFNGGFGGGIEINQCGSVKMDNVNVSGNSALATGAGIDVNSAGKLTMNNVTVTDNHAGAGGGGMYIENSTVEMKNTAIYGNDAYDFYGNKQANDLALDGWRNVTVESDPETSVEGKGSLAGWTNCWPGENEDPELGNLLEVSDEVWLDLVSRWAIPDDGDGDDDGPSGPSGPTTTPGGPTGGIGDGTTTIEDEAVPLAGLFTRADAVGYLWQQAGEPEAALSDFEDVPEDHMWAVAIGWAQDVGIAVADQEGNFRPDDLVLRWVEDHEAEPEGEFEEFLNRYAEYAGIELDADELFIELGGEPEDIVMGEDAQVIFDDFFAKLEEALEELAA